MTKRARIPGLYLEVLLRVLLSRKTSLHLAVSGKVLEHIIDSNIMSHFDQYNILTDKQHGFRRKRSCETQLVATIQKIAQNLISK
jgi:hypothetical protein